MQQFKVEHVTKAADRYCGISDRSAEVILPTAEFAVLLCFPGTCFDGGSWRIEDKLHVYNRGYADTVDGVHVHCMAMGSLHQAVVGQASHQMRSRSAAMQLIGLIYCECVLMNGRDHLCCGQARRNTRTSKSKQNRICRQANKVYVSP
ncbi:MAG: hypothetical protein LBU24_03770 [Methanocalculaceae archaeon]|nr:hypothetical protein [Methanocalculaceae archaeon]